MATQIYVLICCVNRNHLRGRIWVLGTRNNLSQQMFAQWDSQLPARVSRRLSLSKWHHTAGRGLRSIWRMSMWSKRHSGALWRKFQLELHELVRFEVTLELLLRIKISVEIYLIIYTFYCRQCILFRGWAYRSNSVYCLHFLAFVFNTHTVFSQAPFACVLILKYKLTSKFFYVPIFNDYNGKTAVNSYKHNSRSQ